MDVSEVENLEKLDWTLHKKHPNMKRRKAKLDTYIGNGGANVNQTKVTSNRQQAKQKKKKKHSRDHYTPLRHDFWQINMTQQVLFTIILLSTFALHLFPTYVVGFLDNRHTLRYDGEVNIGE